jgi:dipeptidyl-peptidase-4
VSDRSFLDQYARTKRFSLGAPRSPTIAPAGDRVLFLRSVAGADPVTCLWSLDVLSGRERLVVDPRLLSVGDDIPVEELRRRERMRESAGGIVAYATDRTCALAVFALSGRLFRVRLDEPEGEVRELPVQGPVVDPRPDPTGSTVAYVSSGALRVIGIDGSADRAFAEPDGPDVSYGLAEHVAGESMGRQRGFWWSPDGSRVLVARVDESRVERWYLGDPANPTAPPRSVPYPFAGTANADVSLSIFGLDGSRLAVDWDRIAFEYLTSVCWEPAGLLIAVQSRDQQTVQLLRVDPETGSTAVVREDRDPAWVTIVPGLPAVTAAGSVVWTADLDDTRRLLVDGRPVTPPGLQVHELCDVDGEEVLVLASDEPTELHVWSWSPARGLARRTDEPGVRVARQSGGTLVCTEWTWAGERMVIHRAGQPLVTVESRAEIPSVDPRVRLLRVGDQQLRTAVLLPSWHVPGSARLPVLLDPYGGPAGQRVLVGSSFYLLSQWFADQGFAVVITDGRGTPGRGPAWERTVLHEKAEPALADQVIALHAVAAEIDDLDLTRVGIRGWSYGGYLAAVAVLRRPDVFHAAVAGAPPTDMLLYDTHWQERFLGHPAEFPEVYERNSLIADAPRLERPLMLIHGLADDNVSVANTLRLSSVLLAAGKPHSVLPLSGVTHMANQANVHLLELEFLRTHLA